MKSADVRKRNVLSRHTYIREPGSNGNIHASANIYRQHQENQRKAIVGFATPWSRGFLLFRGKMAPN